MEWDLGREDLKDHKEVYFSNNSYEMVKTYSGLKLLAGNDNCYRNFYPAISN